MHTPAAMAFTRPVEALTEAMLVALLLHVPPEMESERDVLVPEQADDAPEITDGG